MLGGGWGDLGGLGRWGRGGEAGFCEAGEGVAFFWGWGDTLGSDFVDVVCIFYLFFEFP